MSKNTRNEKNKRSFITGCSIAVFIVLVILSVVFSCKAQAGTTGDLPITCFTAEEFAAEYQSGSFDIIQKTSVVIFVEGKAYRSEKLLTQGKEGKNTMQGTWLVESTGKFCLLFLEDLGKNPNL